MTPLETGDAMVIGIGMSFLDVHVNRAPIAGRITKRQHFPGLFGSLRRPEMVFRNERFTTIIESDDWQVVVVQIASRLVRQIASFVQESQDVTTRTAHRCHSPRLTGRSRAAVPGRSSSDRQARRSADQPVNRLWRPSNRRWPALHVPDHGPPGKLCMKVHDVIEDKYGLSPMQQGMLFHALYDQRPGLYLDHAVFDFPDQDLNVAAFRRAWGRVVDRHPSLRASFHWEGLEAPLQVHPRKGRPSFRSRRLASTCHRRIKSNGSRRTSNPIGNGDSR